MVLKSEDGFQIQIIQCQNTGICKNDRCFWRQRDQFGLSPFVVFNEEYQKKQLEIKEKYRRIFRFSKKNI